jgi:hypothetical protein
MSVALEARCRFVCTFLEIGLGFSHAPIGCGAAKEIRIPMRDLSAWRRALPVALILALLVLTEVGLIAQNLGSAPQTNVAVQGQTGAQPEGTWLNLINWVGNVVAPVGAGGAALAAIASFAAGRGFSRWAFTAIGLLMVSGLTRLLEFWIQQGTGGIS